MGEFTFILRGQADDKDESQCSKECPFLADTSCRLFGPLLCKTSPPPIERSRHEKCVEMEMTIYQQLSRISW